METLTRLFGKFITRFSLPYSRCRTWPVRNTPCSRAASAAAFHKPSGNGDLPCRVLPPPLQLRINTPQSGRYFTFR